MNTPFLRLFVLFVSGLPGIWLSPAIAAAATSTNTPASSLSSTSFVSVTSTSLFRDYENDLMVGIFPTAPIASLTIHVHVDGGYGDDNAYCRYFGPGSTAAPFSGQKTFPFASLPGGELDRSQAVAICGYYTHEPNGPLDPGDFSVFLEAVDSSGEPVTTWLCVHDFSYDEIPVPGPGQCRYACGDAVCDGGDPKASDALAVLRRALDLYECSPRVCDVDHSGDVSAIDALRVLRRASGLPGPLLCLPGNTNCIEFSAGSTSSTSSSSTTTTTIAASAHGGN